ncbi:MAG: polysaccharide deacetylase family protein [bacterium]|nr:polysaccharide deacetylase family protein [bacterium]
MRRKENGYERYTDRARLHRFEKNKKRKKKIAIISAAVLVSALVGIATTLVLKGDEATVKQQQPQAEVLQQVTNKPEQQSAEENKSDANKTEATATPKATPTTTPDQETTGWVGVNEEGKKYSYDASIISKKLNKYDYKNKGEKIVFLTFDDGASTSVTPKVLDVLDQEDVKATFFVMGSNIVSGGDRAKKLILEEFNRGHAIANHSYSHNYKTLYPNRTLNLKNFVKDFNKNEKLLKEIIGEGFSTRVLRCPGGFMSWKGMSELTDYMNKNDMYSIDWNALSKDAEGKKKNADELYKCAVETAKGKEIVVLLMHDTYGKEETAKSLPKIIRYFKKNGYEFKTLV